MLRQFLVGGGVSAINIVIHALVTTVVVSAANVTGSRSHARPHLFLIIVMTATVSVLMAGHACEVIAWSLAYEIFNVAPDNTHLLYFAFVNYTTLGYGDVVPLERWRLLGPITAMNGILLFGWSTAVIFEVLRQAMTRSSLAGATRKSR